MLTIITSLYKSEKYLTKYLKNVSFFAIFLTAKKINFELIIIANSPSEKEKKQCAILKKYDWFKFIEVQQEPLYASWNRGINMAKYDNIAFWNVDDIRFPEATIESLNLINKGAEIVYFPFMIKWYLNLFNISFLVKKNNIKPIPFNQKMFTEGMHCGPFFMFTKKTYNKVGPFDEQFKIAGDFDWCVRAAKITNAFALAKNSAGIFRVDGQGLSAGSKKRFILENNIVLARHHLPNKLTDFSQEETTKFEINQILYNNEFINF